MTIEIIMIAMTRKYPLWGVALILAAAVLITGCTDSSGSGTGSPYSGTEQYPRFDAIVTDASIYNVGEVVEFELVSKSPGKGKFDDHPCSYRLLKEEADGSWQFLAEPVDTWSAAPGTVRYPEGCDALRFATTNWEPGKYRIQYKYGVSALFTVRNVPVIAAS
ncbi:MAG TPA: hypothetical protein HA272_01805 [Methanoregula sp.]|nr:hypothetical protein [Methanoregula sp.]